MSRPNPPQHSHWSDEGSVPILHGPLNAAEQAAQEERQKRDAKEQSDRAFQERQVVAVEASNALARRNFSLAIVVGVVSAIACGAAWYQSVINRRSLDTANETLRQIRADAESSSKQFQVQLGHFDAGLGRSDVLATKAGEQAQASRKFADASAKQAEVSRRSLQATIDNFHLEQRPWISVQSVQTKGLQRPQNRSEHDIFFESVDAQLANIGRTPALNVHQEALATERNWEDTPPTYESALADYERETRASEKHYKPPKYQTWVVPHGNGTPDEWMIAPGDKNPYTVIPYDLSFPLYKPERRTVKPGIYLPGTVYILGKLIYSDIFGAKDHQTWFCFYSNGDSFQLCPYGNRMK